MIKNKFLLSILIVLFQLTAFSQNQYVYYFDKDFNLVEQSKSVFNGIGIYENGLFGLRVYNSLNKNLVMLEYFKDSSLQMGDGFFGSYYANKAKEWEGNYSQGKQDGLWQKWDSLGNIIDSSIYDNGEKIMQANFIYNYPDIAFLILHIDSLKSGSYTETQFDRNRKIISRENFKKSEDPDKVFIKVEIDAQFPGGPTAWFHYLAKAIQGQQGQIDEFTESDYGTCVVRLIVDKTGKISNVEAMTMKGTKLAEIAINAIEKGPDWVPARQNGRVVNAYRLQPVTIQKPNE